MGKVQPILGQWSDEEMLTGDSYTIDDILRHAFGLADAPMKGVVPSVPALEPAELRMQLSHEFPWGCFEWRSPTPEELEDLAVAFGLKETGVGAFVTESADFRSVTAEFWQCRYQEQLSSNDVREIIENVTGFFDLLSKWQRYEKA